MTDFSTMCAADFEALQGTAFAISSADTAVQLSVVEVRELSSGLRDGGAFSVLWQGPSEPALPQATYPLTHEAHGTQELFLVPVARTDAGYQYESIFT